MFVSGKKLQPSKLRWNIPQTIGNKTLVVTINQSLSVLKNLLKLWHSNPATAVESGLLGRSYYHIASDHSEGHFRPSDFSYSLVFDSSSAMSNSQHPSQVLVTVAINRHWWHKHSRLRPYATLPTATSVAT